MTIVEEIDKKSNRPHRSKNIVDALKYAFDLKETPQNIGEAVKAGLGTGGGYKGLSSVDLSLSIKSIPDGYEITKLQLDSSIIADDEDTMSFVLNIQLPLPSVVKIPVIDGIGTHFNRIYGEAMGGDTKHWIGANLSESDLSGDVELDEEYVAVANGDCAIACTFVNED